VAGINADAQGAMGCRVGNLGLPKPTEAQLISLEGRCVGVKGILEEFASPWVVDVLTPFEGAERAPEHLKDDLVAYNAWTAMYAIQQILEGSVRSGKNLQQRYEVVLLDRGVFDATAWLHLFEAKGELEDEDHKDTFTDFLRLKKWSPCCDRCSSFSALPQWRWNGNRVEN
jgi:hypothetical protein